MSERPGTTGNYTPKRRGALGHGYSFFVKVMKLALPALALAIIGTVIVRLSSEPEVESKISLFPSTEKTTPGQIEMVGGRYEGVDADGNPYTITAERASRAMNSPDSGVLEKILADITLSDKTWIAVKAGSGDFDRLTEVLKLQDEVHAFHDSGYEVVMKDLAMNLKEKSAFTVSPVTGHGPLGAVTAQNMTVTDQGNLVVFGGPVTLTIFSLSPKKGRG